VPAARLGARSRSRAILLNLSLFAATVVVFLPVLEIALRAAWPPPKVYRALKPGLRTVFTSKHSPGVQGPAVFAVNSMGVRAREFGAARAQEYRILCIGGSTTESLVNDQGRIWTTLLERLLDPWPDGRRVWVGNAGRSGLTSRHHVLQMTHLPAVYDPDAVVLLVGINDLSRRLSQGESYDPGFARRPENQLLLMREAFAVFPGQFAGEWPDDPWIKRTRLWQLVRMFKYRILRRSEVQDPDGESFARWRRYRASGGRISTLPPLDDALDEYGDNLRRIAALARGRGTRLLLVTQPSMWRADLSEAEKALLWLGGVGDFQNRPGSLYYEPEALAQGMEAYNRRLLAVSADTGTESVDLAAAVPKTSQYFWDDCHFTDEGEALVARVLGEAIRSKAPFTRPRGGTAVP
jgi:lysophospholipase L1-like esterase